MENDKMNIKLGKEANAACFLDLNNKIKQSKSKKTLKQEEDYEQCRIRAKQIVDGFVTVWSRDSVDNYAFAFTDDKEWRNNYPELSELINDIESKRRDKNDN